MAKSYIESFDNLTNTVLREDENKNETTENSFQ